MKTDKTSPTLQSAQKVKPSRGAAPTLMVVSGPDAGRALSLTAAQFKVGTSSECQLKLSDPLVSRRHFEASWADDGLHVKDLKSRNGTWLNGARLAEATVVVGSTLCVGDTRLLLAESSDAVDVKPSPLTRLGGLIGVGLPMRRLFTLLETLAPAEISLLLLGETGTGKDTIAREIHARSTRAQGPFTVVDCAAVAPNLIESELFGHERGAFTGATQRHIGAFERSHRGTVFLDEIGELPLELQPKLLRVLEDRTVQRVGGKDRTPIDVRIVSATHRDLPELIRTGRFRADLYYRLSVAQLQVPALRDRPEDIPELVAALLARTGKGRAPFEVSPETIASLQRYDWPGNVRELRNLVERAAAFKDEKHLKLAHGALAARANVALSPEVRQLSYKEAKRVVLDLFERDYVAALLERFDHNYSRASREADIDRNHLSDVAQRHGLTRTRT